MRGHPVLGLGMLPKKNKINKIRKIRKKRWRRKSRDLLFTYLPLSYWITCTHAHTLETFCYMKIHFRFCFFLYYTLSRAHWLKIRIVQLSLRKNASFKTLRKFCSLWFRWPLNLGAFRNYSYLFFLIIFFHFIFF